MRAAIQNSRIDDRQQCDSQVVNIGQLTLREVIGRLGRFLSTQKPANGAISRVKMEGEISSVCWHTFKASNNQSLLK